MVELNEWIAAQAPATSQYYLSQISVKERLAALGELDADSVYGVQPIRRYPEMYELHWFWRATDLKGDVHVRQYHSEPGECADLLVRLHRHIKKTDVEDVSGAQNIEIGFAQLRFVSGHPYH